MNDAKQEDILHHIIAAIQNKSLPANGLKPKLAKFGLQTRFPPLVVCLALDGHKAGRLLLLKEVGVQVPEVLKAAEQWQTFTNQAHKGEGAHLHKSYRHAGDWPRKTERYGLVGAIHAIFELAVVEVLQRISKACECGCVSQSMTEHQCTLEPGKGSWRWQGAWT